MRILILGGTLFLGRHLVEAALACGHTITLFNRGRTDPSGFPGVERLRGDRAGGDLDALRHGSWDALVDTSGYVPRAVRQSAELLRDRVGTYAFISSISVYADFSRAGIDETSPVRLPEDASSEDVPKEYGGLKTLCERAVAEVFPHRALVVRSGLLVGPHDPTERLTWWVRRIARGGDVLAPGSPDRQIQLIHARDAADWIISMLERGRGGTYNVTGPAERLTMRELLDACRRVSASDARFVWVEDAFLLEHEVRPFSEMPLWLPPGWDGMLAVDIRRALQEGLTFRSLEDTIGEILEWDAGRPPEERRPREMVAGFVIESGVDPDREKRLLEAWRAG